MSVTHTSKDPFSGALPTTVELEQIYRSMVISASGWRKVFAPSGEEEDDSTEISRQDAYIVAIATEAYYRERTPRQ